MLNSKLWHRLSAALRARNHNWRLRRNRRRYRRALQSLAALGRLDWPTLLEAQEKLLPLPPEVLAQKSSEVASDEASLVLLAIRYEDWLRHPATADFLGRCYLIQRDLGEAILRGDRTTEGRDLSDQLRGAYRVLSNMLTLPAKVQAQREFVEREILGVVRSLSAPEDGAA